MTGIYTFRMIFRAFWGEPVEEARELEHGHLHHAEVPRNPMTGEEEDTDVGFPGPGHFIAEREWPMKIAMGTLGAAGGRGRRGPDPRGRRRGHEVPRSDVRRLPARARRLVAHRVSWVGLIIGALIAMAGIAIAYRIWVVEPGIIFAAARAILLRLRSSRPQVVLR